MTYIAEIGVLGFKIETTPGTVEVITGAECKLLFEDLAFTVEPVSVEQPVVKPKMGVIKQRPGGRSCTISFKVGLKGSGTPGVAPAIGDLLKACSMAETVRTGIGVWYKPTTLSVATQPTLTLYFNNDGYYCQATGCAGTVKFTGAGNEIHYAEFEFRGVFAGDGTAAMLVPSLETTHPDVLLESWLTILEYHTSSTRIQTVAGSYDLRSGAAAHVQLAAVIDNTAGGALQVGRVRAYLKRTGTPSGYTNGIRASIQGDTAGVPDGVTIASSAWLDPLYLRDDAYDWVDFIFTPGVALSAATKYHVVLEGDYTFGANIIDWANYSVAATTSSTYNGTIWAAVGASVDFIVDIGVADGATCLNLAGAELDIANVTNLRQNVSCAPEGWDRAFISNRAPTLALEPELEPTTSRDFLAYQHDGRDLFVGYQVGATRGNIVELAMDYAQLTGVGEMGERDGASTRPLTLMANSGLPVTAGDDEFTLVFT